MTAVRIALSVLAGGYMVYVATGYACERIDRWLERKGWDR